MNTLDHLLAILELTWLAVGTILGCLGLVVVGLAFVAGAVTLVNKWRKRI